MVTPLQPFPCDRTGLQASRFKLNQALIRIFATRPLRSNMSPCDQHTREIGAWQGFLPQVAILAGNISGRGETLFTLPPHEKRASPASSFLLSTISRRILLEKSRCISAHAFKNAHSRGLLRLSWQRAKAAPSVGSCCRSPLKICQLFEIFINESHCL
jgi:hypothetical protein